MTTRNPILTRELRNVVRSACTAQPGWNAWRTANMPGRDSGNMRTAEVRKAARDLGVDIEAVAAAHGIAVTYFDDDADAIAAAPAPAPAAPAHEAPAMTPAPAAPATSAAPHAFTGRDPETLVNAALGAASDFLSAKVLADIKAGLLPLAEAAAMPPRIVTQTVTRTVNVGVTGTAPDGTPTRVCNVLRTTPGRDVLDVKAADCGSWRTALDAPLSVWDGTAAEGVPEIDPHHVWDVEALAYLAIASRYADDGHKLRNMSRVLMYGPAGTGKTSTAEQFAARTGRPFVRIAFDRNTEAQDLIGQRMPKAGGGTEFRDGALVAAMQVPGCVILTDEPSFVRPGVAAVLQTILDKGCVYLKEDGNRRVDLAPGVVIVAADNTNLTGDETGRYADTLTQNVALQDRFAWLVSMDYLPEAREAGVLANRTGIPVEAARAMVGFASTTRKGAANGQLTTGCSLRRLIAWAVGVQSGIPSSHAFKAAVLNAADASDREAIRGLEKNTAPHATIDALVRGTAPVTEAVTATPQGAAAASMFSAVEG